MGDRHLVTTRATPRLCHRCHALVLTGHTEGVPAVADPAPLTPSGELVALLAGRDTYTYAPYRSELVYRDDYRIRGGLPGPVLPAHVCGHPMAPECLAPDPPTPEHPAAPDDGSPPF